jgi:hypothetical protein
LQLGDLAEGIFRYCSGEASVGGIAEAFFRYPLGLTHAETGNAAITENLFRYSTGIFPSP